MFARLLLSAALALAAVTGTAWSKPARCYTTQDGEYDCDFAVTDGEGSFEISAPGKPGFSLVIDEPGVAFGFGDYGDGGVSLPGRFIRSVDDPACWENDVTGTEICAW